LFLYFLLFFSSKYPTKNPTATKIFIPREARTSWMSAYIEVIRCT